MSAGGPRERILTRMMMNDKRGERDFATGVARGDPRSMMAGSDRLLGKQGLCLSTVATFVETLEISYGDETYDGIT